MEDIKSTTRHEAASPLLINPAWLASEIAHNGPIYDERLNDGGFKRRKWTSVWSFSYTGLVALEDLGMNVSGSHIYRPFASLTPTSI